MSLCTHDFLVFKNILHPQKNNQRLYERVQYCSPQALSAGLGCVHLLAQIRPLGLGGANTIRTFSLFVSDSAIKHLSMSFANICSQHRSGETQGLWLLSQALQHDTEAF